MATETVKSPKLFKFSVGALIMLILVSIMLAADVPTLQLIRDELRLQLIKNQLERETPTANKILNQAWTYYQLGYYKRAEELFNRNYEADQNISSLYGLALIDIKNRRFQKATVKFEKVLSESPNHTDSLLNLGQLYFRQGYFTKSEHLFAKALESEPTNSMTRIWLGKAYIKMNEMTKARDILATVTSGRHAAEAAALVKGLNVY